MILYLSPNSAKGPQTRTSNESFLLKPLKMSARVILEKSFGFYSVSEIFHLHKRKSAQNGTNLQ